MMNDASKLNIYHELFSCDRVYDAEKAWSELQPHDYFEISMVISGNGVHLVLDQSIPCKEGDIFVSPPNIPHRFFVENRGESIGIRSLRFFCEEWHEESYSAPDNLRGCYGLFGDGSVTAYAMLNRSMYEKIVGLYDAIECEIAERQKSWQDAVAGNLSLLLINVKRYIDSSIKNNSNISPVEWNVVLTAIQIIKNNFTDATLTLGTIAETLGVSKAHLSRIFRKLAGEGFAEYLRKVRIEYACKLLREENLTVEEIVASCGLRDTPSFYKNFALHTAMTPNEYRHRNKKSADIADVDNNKEKKEDIIMVILSEISENLQKGKAKIVKEMVQQAIDEGADPEQILNEGLISGMNIIGEKFKNNEVYVPEVLVAARAMNMGTQILKPYLAAQGIKASGKVCIGTVQGDLHDIGKNLVKMMMEGKGLEVVDLGTDVAAEAFVQTAIEQNCQVICCSALLTTTMGVMGEVVKAAEAAGIRDKVKIMVGGAPVNEDFCKKIGADCYTVDAASAAEAAVEFCKA